MLTGEVYSKDTLSHAFEFLYPMFGSTMSYGRRFMVIDAPDPDAPSIWLGHLSGSPDSKGVVIYDTNRGTSSQWH